MSNYKNWLKFNPSVPFLSTYTVKKIGASTIETEGAVIWSNATPPEILAMASHIEIKAVKGARVIRNVPKSMITKLRL